MDELLYERMDAIPPMQVHRYEFSVIFHDPPDLPERRFDAAVFIQSASASDTVHNAIPKRKIFDVGENKKNAVLNPQLFCPLDGFGQHPE